MSGAQDKMSRHIYVDHRGLCSSAPNAPNSPVQGGGRRRLVYGSRIKRRGLYVGIIKVCARNARNAPNSPVQGGRRCEWGSG